MFKILFTCMLCSLMLTGNLFAQQTFTIPDSTAYTIDGLTLGYHIVNEKEKEVGDKGNFSRYAMQFYITNSSSEAKIILYKDGFLPGDASPYLVQFDCSNATGARLTSKTVSLQAEACTVLAAVEDKDCTTGKVQQHKRVVQIGYWIKAGQTISARTIMITPLNELPNIRGILFPYVNSKIANTVQLQSAKVAAPSPAIGLMNFYKLRNVFKGSFLNNQNGPLVCTSINNEWWSAQWKLVSIEGGAYYIIKNKWKASFISTADPNMMLSDDYNANTSWWIVEPVYNTNMYRLKNVADGTYLNIETGKVQSTVVREDALSSRWTLEP